MIEQTLQNAANNLPDPHSDFLAVKQRVKQKTRKIKAAPRKRQLAILMVLAVLLVGCVAAAAPDYHLYNGSWSDYQNIPGLAWKDTQTAAANLGITLPKTLGGHPVIDVGRYNLTNQDVPYWYALLAPRYVYYSSYYGMEMEEPYISEDGHEGTRHWREGAEVTYGSTDDEIWRRQFGYDENDVFIASTYALLNRTYGEISSFDYEGLTVYVGWIKYKTYEHPHWDVTWVDYDKGAVFSVDGEAETPDALIEYAKEIIDLNR